MVEVPQAQINLIYCTTMVRSMLCQFVFVVVCGKKCIQKLEDAFGVRVRAAMSVWL
jgi:hypothetical protein